MQLAFGQQITLALDIRDKDVGKETVEGDTRMRVILEFAGTEKRLSEQLKEKVVGELAQAVWAVFWIGAVFVRVPEDGGVPLPG